MATTVDAAAGGKALAPAQKIKKIKRKWSWDEVKKHISYVTMVLPGTVFLFIFAYMPLPAITMAFKNYKLASRIPKGFWLQNRFLYSLFYNSPWVGFENFRFIFSSGDYPIFMRNTLGYNLMFMAVGLVFAVGIAIGINELRQRLAAKFYHTVLFLPYFLSWIIVTYIVYALISSNGMLTKFAAANDWNMPNLYTQITAWPFIFLFANVWRYAGNSSILYLATLSGFSQDLYEAATIDGAGKFKQFLYVTLPQLVPTIILLQILAVGRILNSDFDMFYNLPNGSGSLRPAYLTIDVYVYAAISRAANLGMPAAAGLFQSLIGFTLVLVTNGIVNKVDKDMAMF